MGLDNGGTSARVVIADCDAGRRASLRAVVQRFDPQAAIEEATSGQALCDILLQRRPTLAFVSLQLEDLSGPEAVAVARRAGAEPPCLVLVATRVMPHWQEIATSLGAYEVLKTPLDPGHIEQLLHADARRRTPTRALLACSTPAGRSAISRVVARSGFAIELDETDDGRHALKQFKHAAYDFAFIDVKLNGIDGMELACQIQPLGLATRITLLTTSELEPVAQAGRYFGVDAVLRMPFYARDIDLALHNALGLRRPYLLNALTAPPAPSALLRIADLPNARRKIA
ncbi:MULTISPECIES: response regulator [Methylobacterium]|jgi:CheY-like chemotaxis protein|uniref:Response regulator n=1 Tax=Methylobacterium longum TaxID=767694 RepID=A0ABT8AUU7_9HYPH|nr:MULTISPECIES: response regulator [Methylobacterium]MCJ2097392.1 response regulator [Methylobacterium sp. E-046]MDN3573651.1 response regulator [Methylobacterium longum]GJE14078.1 Regulator of RpoS [Methylobacterium longum]